MLSYLAIVKSPDNRYIMDIPVQHGSHLRFLYRTNPPLRVQDKHRHILLPPQPIYRRRSRISTRGSNHCQMVPLSPLTTTASSALHSLILPYQEVLKQVSQKLQRNIFKRESRPPKQLQQVQVLPRYKRKLQRRDLGMSERSIRPRNQLPQVRGWNLGRGDVQREHLEREVLEGEVRPGAFPVAWRGRDFLGNEESVVACETFENCGFEGELWSRGGVGQLALGVDSSGREGGRRKWKGM